MTAFFAVMLPLVLSLGLWQLDRRAEKQGYEDQYYDRMGMLPVAPGDAAEYVPFQRLRLTGTFEAERTFLVDNQIHQGRPGYWVVTSFKDSGGRRWLVNRGWVPAPESRDALPGFRTPAGKLMLVGVVWPDTGLPPVLAEDSWADGWPKRVQRLDVARMSQLFERVAPVELRLERGQPGVFTSAGMNLDFRASRHMGYAVQWFGLALALIAGYVIYGFKRHG